jgi:hypothetical protein
MYLFEVKKPSSPSPWDFYKLRATIPAAGRSGPWAGGCPLVKK